LVFESFVFEPIAEGPLDPRHTDLDQAAAMVAGASAKPVDFA